MIWIVCCEAGHGWDGETFSDGASYGNMIEYDLTHKFCEQLGHEMERASLRFKIIDNYTKGISKNAQIEPNALFVSIHFHSFASDAINCSNILYNDNKNAARVAETVTWVLGRWGEQTTTRYTGCTFKPGKYPYFYKENASIIVNPFSITGVDAVLYYERLGTLAMLLAWELTRLATALNPAVLNYCPLSLDR